MSTRQLLEHQLALLDLEREEDLRQYHESVLRRTLKERVEKGVTWYPVQVNRHFIGTGERVFIDLERTAPPDAKNALQSGSIVSLFGKDGDKESGRVSGVVYHLRKNSMRLILSSHEPPYWLRQSRLGVDLDFDDKTYREMRAAVKTVIEAKNDRLAELREILLGKVNPEFGEWDYTYGSAVLNRSQERAVQKVLEAKDVAIIHGPPGTGKTTTLVQAVLETLKREHQILVCAPSNTAVDLLTLRCAAEGINVLRIGNPARVEEELHEHTLDETIRQHPDYESLRKMRKEVEQLYKQAHKHKRQFGRREYEQRKSLLKDARDFKQYAETLEEYIVNQVVDRAQVIACTLTGTAHKLVAKRKFHTVFIDEAAQALAPACWIAIERAQRVIFVGDHCQLPPTVKSMEADKGGLGVSLMETLIENKNEVASMLEEQYRMNQQIMGFSSEQFYDGKLKAAPGIGGRSLGEDFPAFEFVDTAGCGFGEKKNSSLSTYNREEAQLLLKHLAMLIAQLEGERPEVLKTHFSIGVIAPYKAQVKELQEQLEASPMLSSYLPQIKISTVDGFQGQECDVVYISLVRSNDKGEIGFLKDIRRTNVALTRARKKLVVVGDSATLSQFPFYQRFFDYVEKMGAYRSAWDLLHAGA
jgi:ATP-dependent RNA/DNA helicase IGHMBP2